MEIATHLNSVNLWHVTNGRTLEADAVVEEQFFISFSWFQFVMLANFGLVSLLPLIWEKTKFSSPEVKWFIGEMFYPPALLLLLETTAFCFLSCVSFTVSKSVWQWGEGIWHHSPACPVCTGCQGNTWPRGQVSLSAGSLWSFLPSPT